MIHCTLRLRPYRFTSILEDLYQDAYQAFVSTEIFCSLDVPLGTDRLLIAMSTWVRFT